MISPAIINSPKHIQSLVNLRNTPYMDQKAKEQVKSMDNPMNSVQRNVRET